MVILSPSIVSYYHLFFTILACVILSLVYFLTRSSNPKRGRRNLPPGPPGWPVVGNLFQVAASGKPFYEYVDELKPKYGPIFTLKMGTRTLIVLTGSKLVHEAFIERGTLFASRPKENPTRTIFSANKFSVNAAVYGPVWRSLRRNMVQNMLSSSRIKEFRHVRERAMDRLVERLHIEAEANEGIVWVIKNARFAVFCILLAMCFGIDMDEETIVKMDQTMKKVLVVLNPRIDDFFPILSPFFSKQRKTVNEVRKEQVGFMVPFIDQRRKALQNPGTDRAALSFSYLDTLFDLKVDGRKSGPTDPELVTLCSEFINGGTDTTATAVEWGLVELILNPEVQERLYREIQGTVGDKKVNEKDVEKMPYLHAVVKEILRKHPPTYFVLSHAVTEETTLGGYDIPRDASVEAFSAGIGSDSNLWSDPKRFDPDRFASGREDADITGSTGVKMMPFGVGRRICPGLALGTVHLQLMIARMVQEFEWSAYLPGGQIDFTGKLEFTVVKKNPLRAMIKSRV